MHVTKNYLGFQQAFNGNQECCVACIGSYVNNGDGIMCKACDDKLNSTPAIAVDMVSAIKVQFITPIFEDDFPERGMTAWLTGVEWDTKHDAYQLFFDFTEFENVNAKYFRDVYYPNRHTAALGLDKQMYTALEAGQYTAKYSVLFSVNSNDMRDDAAFAEQIKQHLEVV